MLDEIQKKLAEKAEIYLRIRVRPNASRTAVTGVAVAEEGQTVKIDVAAPPEKGKANQELIKFLAKEFGVDKNEVKIISGAGERIKLLKVTSNKKQ